MPAQEHLDALIAADPVGDRAPTPAHREATRARLDALLTADPPTRTRPTRRLRTVAVGGLVALATAAAVVGVSLAGDAPTPAQAFAARLQGDGIVHIVFAHERTHSASGDGVNPRQDELWMSLADGRWRVRIRLFGHYIDYAFDGRTITTYSSRTGKTTTDTPADPATVAGHPFPGPMSAGVLPLLDVQADRLKIAGEVTLNGETVYDLVPTQGSPAGLEMHWYVSKDGQLRRLVQSAADTIDESTGTRGPSSLTTDVETYDVLRPTTSNQQLLRPHPQG